MFKKIYLSKDWAITIFLIVVWFVVMFTLQYSSSGNLIAKEILNALKYLFISFIIFQIYSLAINKAKTLGLRAVLWQGFLWCTGIAVMFSINLGSPSCIESEQDNRGSTCIEYANDGYEPSSQERYAEFAFFFILFYVPVIAGARKQEQ